MQANTTGGSSVGIGWEALKANTTGNANTAVGMRALLSNTTASNNTAVGREVLKANTTGYSNAASGYNALLINTTGYQNTAVGTAALQSNTTGFDNTGVGYSALLNTSTAIRTIGLGPYAMQNLTTGNYNVGVGSFAGNNVTTGGYNLFLGHNTTLASVANSQSIVIGTGSGGTVGKGTNTGFINPNGGGVYQGNNSSSWTQTSDRRLKKNIVDNDVGLSKINAIQVRNFEYKTPEEVESDGVIDKGQAIETTGTILGVIAQELELVCPDCVNTQPDTGVKSIVTDDVMWHMVNAIKELSTQNAALAARLTALEE